MTRFFFYHSVFFLHFYTFPTALFVYTGCFVLKTPKVKKGECCTINRPILPPSFPSRDGLHEHWQPWRSQVLLNNDQDSFSLSLYRLTQGLVGPAGNVWAQRQPSPRKKVAPQSLPTSWETPMPLVSPPVLSCRIHDSSLSSESHTVQAGFFCFQCLHANAHVC